MSHFYRKPLSRGLSMRITPISVEPRQGSIAKRCSEQAEVHRRSREDATETAFLRDERDCDDCRQDEQEVEDPRLAYLSERVARLEQERYVLQGVVMQQKCSMMDFQSAFEKVQMSTYQQTKLLLYVQIDVERVDHALEAVAKQCAKADYTQSFDRQIRALEAQLNVLNTRLDSCDQFRAQAAARFVPRQDFQQQSQTLLEQLRVIQTAVRNFQFSSK